MHNYELYSHTLPQPVLNWFSITQPENYYLEQSVYKKNITTDLQNEHSFGYGK